MYKPLLTRPKGKRPKALQPAAPPVLKEYFVRYSVVKEGVRHLGHGQVFEVSRPKALRYALGLLLSLCRPCAGYTHHTVTIGKDRPAHAKAHKLN
jgi:hypothetical protein